MAVNNKYISRYMDSQGNAEAEKKPTRSPASIAALSWAAEREGMSYGQFCIGLSWERQVRIQEDYEAWKREEARQKAKRRAERETKRVGNTSADAADGAIPEAFILTDDDM